MTIEYQLEPDDLIAFSEELRRLTPDSISRSFYLAVLPVLGVGLAVAIDSFPIAALFTALYISSGWLFQKWAQIRYARMTYSIALSFSTRRWQAKITDEGFSVSCEAVAAVYSWSFIQEIIRGPRYISFVLTPIQRVHIPVRAFSNEEHLRTFIDTAQSHLKHIAK